MYRTAFPITPDALDLHATDLEGLAADREHFCATDGIWRVRTDAVREARDARDCAHWMRQAGVSERASIGPFHSDALPERSEFLLVRRGAAVHSMRPGVPVQPSPRGQRIKVERVFRGWVDRSSGSPRVIPAEIHWAGSGGYFRWVDLNDIERAQH